MSGKTIGDYDNGSASGNGRSEYIWLPTGDGAIPVGLFRNGRFFAIHTDHLGTPRLMTNDVNKPVWQWPYSAFGTTEPTGLMKATPRPKQAMTNQPVLLKTTAPAQRFDLRYPGQMKDAETNTNQNIMRSYWPMHGAYTQADPIGLEGGLSRFGYVSGSPLSSIDPQGLMGGSGSGANRPKPAEVYVPLDVNILNPPKLEPDRECMQRKFDEWFSKYGSDLAKEFSVLSLYPNNKNIDNHPLTSAGLAAGGVVAKVGAHRVLSPMQNFFAQATAKGLSVFGRFIATPFTAAATAANIKAAEECSCGRNLWTPRQLRIRNGALLQSARSSGSLCSPSHWPWAFLPSLTR